MSDRFKCHFTQILADKKKNASRLIKRSHTLVNEIDSIKLYQNK